MLKGVVLAAGRGSRLNPLTRTRPKHLLPVAGEPMIIRVVKELRKAGISEVGIIVHYQKEKLMKMIGDGRRYNVKVTYLEQSEILGTAHAIGEAENYIGDERFLIVYGDVTVKSNVIRKALKIHREKEASATIVSVQVDDPWNYGVFEINDEGMVKRIVEKPEKGREPSKWINAGIYIVEGRKIFRAVDKTPKSQRGEYEFTDTLRILIDEGEKVIACRLSGDWWFDIGRPWDLLEANRKIMLEEVEKGSWRSGVKLGRNVKIYSNVELRMPVIVNDNCIIKEGAIIGPYTYLGRGVKIGNGSEIKNSIILDETWIGSNCTVEHTIIGANCTVEGHVHFKCRNRDESNVFMNIKGVKIDSGRKCLGSVIGDLSFIGYASIVEPGMTIYPSSLVMRRKIVYRDVEGFY